MRELHVLAGLADQLLEIAIEQSRILRLDAAARVEHFEQREARQALDVDVGLTARAGVHELPAILPLAQVEDVVLRALSGSVKTVYASWIVRKRRASPVSLLSGWNRCASRRYTRWIVSGSAFGLICSSS